VSYFIGEHSGCNQGNMKVWLIAIALLLIAFVFGWLRR
jgi:hypothetical protein